MKNILLITLLFVSTLGFSQASFESEEFTINIDTEDVVDTTSSFYGNPALQLYSINNSWESAWLLDEQLQLIDRLDVYRKKATTRKIVGASMIATGLAGLWYVGEMDEPIYLTGDPNDPSIIANNKAADDQKAKRKYVAWPSAIIAGVGALVYVDSFKFSKWTNLELGLANIRITQAIYGNQGRKYFRGKKNDLKNKQLWRPSYPRYHK